VIGFYSISLFIIKYHHKIIRWILLFGLLPVAYVITGMLILNYGAADEQKYDRYIVYQDLNRKNRYVVVQDYINWKHNSPRVDTSLIHDYWILRHVNHLDSLDIKGTWIKYSESGIILDTLKID
jgi:hypothetical protein